MRGYQKNVIFLKNTGSSVFEEAYFVVKADKSEIFKGEKNTTELVKEANRIIEENAYYAREKRRKNKIDFKSVVIFGLGFLLSALIFLLTVFI